MSRRLVAIALAAGLLQACDRDGREGPSSKAFAARATAPSSSAAMEPKTRQPVAIGNWQKSPLYDFRLVAVEFCGAAADAGAASPVASNKPRLGVTIDVQAGADQLWLTPKAATLEKDGAVIQAELEPEPSQDCEEPLLPQRLLPGKGATGVVVFELPSDEYARSALLAFEPPRWRGAPRFEVEMPDCPSKCDGG